MYRAKVWFVSGEIEEFGPANMIDYHDRFLIVWNRREKDNTNALWIPAEQIRKVEISYIGKEIK